MVGRPQDSLRIIALSTFVYDSMLTDAAPSESQMTPEEWEQFDTRRPRLSVSGLSSALALHFGLGGDLAPLAEEREQVFSMAAEDGATLIVRASLLDALSESAVVQSEALDAVAAADPSLPVPRVHRSRRGRAIELAREGKNEYQIRVLSCLPGHPRGAPWNDATLRHVGVTVGRLDRALATCQSSETAFPLLWNLSDAHQIRSFAQFIKEPRLRGLVARAIDAFEGDALPRMRDLPTQLIHNDISPKNLLFEGSNLTELSGIIDFGDVVSAPRVVDLGIAIARFALPESPLSSVKPLVEGYNEASALNSLELSLLPSIVCARLAMRIAIWSWRLHRFEREIITPVRDASELLSALVQLGNNAFVHSATEPQR